jgi:N6-L-threonylcarbamoyladenine synthase
VLATTPDESIGRVFDKVSRLLALPWSAKGPGASLEEFVAASPVEDHLAPPMPRTMPGILGFSFAGLHSAVERFVTARGGAAVLDTATKRALAGGFQTAAISQLEEKVALALKWCRDQGYGVKHLVVSGGVASNSYLRNRYVKFQGKSYLDADCSRIGAFLLDACPQDSISLIFPPPELCTGKLLLSTPCLFS